MTLSPDKHAVLFGDLFDPGAEELETRHLTLELDLARSPFSAIVI